LGDGATVVTFRATDNRGATASTINTITVLAPTNTSTSPIYNPNNGHYYQFVPVNGLSWNEVNTAANSRTHNNMKGYLATFTTVAELAFINANSTALGFTGVSNIYIGASDAAEEGRWRWVSGPEELAEGGFGTTFFFNNAWVGESFSGNYGWKNPQASEDYLYLYAFFEPKFYITTSDNRSSQGGGGPGGFFVEYSNTAPVVAITGGNRTIADTNNTAGESVALTATATDSDGTIASSQWLVAGQLVATGTSATLALADGATSVTFRATDNSGATTSITVTITVTSPTVDSGSVSLIKIIDAVLDVNVNPPADPQITLDTAFPNAQRGDGVIDQMTSELWVDSGLFWIKQDGFWVYNGSSWINDAPPVVAITGGNRTIADTNNAAGESVALTATATDNAGTIISTEWLVLGQVVATGTSATIALPDGATTITFRATDDRGMTTSTTATITVTAAALPLTLTGTSKNDSLTGGAGNDTLSGSGGNDTLTALAGNDVLEGGAGDDLMIGGAGDDLYVVGNAGDVVQEAADEGTDRVETVISYTLPSHVENLVLRASASALSGTGNAANNLLLGNANANTLSGLAGNDTLEGGAGADVLNGGDGDDIARYAGSKAQYLITLAGSVFTSVQDQRSGSPEGTDSLNGIERLQFSDGTFQVSDFDTTAPTVATFSPTDGLTNVAVGSNILLTFSEAVKFGASGTIVIRQGSAAGTVVASYDVATNAGVNLSISGSTLTINPSSNLGYSTDYYVTFSSGAILDLANNAFAGTSTYNFITVIGQGSALALSEAESTDYLGTYNSIAVDPRYDLEVNHVGLIIIDRSRLHSCVRIFENSQPAQVAGMNKIDVTFNILSLDTGAIQIISTRPFSDQFSTDAQPAECSGRFDTKTGIYRDYINLGAQLFDVSFRLVNGDTLEFSLVDAQEVLIKD
jgi:Ca2+-binding RTX toxin-like protein